ncbi:MAG TPA: MmgE/PrpD family protein [Burkholderiales bacterium]|nr:MmgE/PrpD family protein [Burkholderiales bacterium]
MANNENQARDQATANTRELIRWASGAVSQPLPDAVRRRTATILADDIGAMVAGSLEPQVARAQEGFARTASAKAEATVFAKGAPRLDRYAAASANGMAITWCELDEGFRNASCHGGAYTIPALLAEAEAQGRTVDEVLRALALAYEVTTRFALAFPFPVFNVHPHAAFATIGAAAATSLVRRYDAKTMLDAVTGAASMSFAGPFDTAVEGSLVRNGWTAAGAWIGLRAADWAEAGIGGAANTPYDVFVGAYKTGAVPHALVDGLGAAWSVTNGYHKIFACCGYAHSAVEATLELLGGLQKRKVDDIAEIVVETGPGGQALRTVEPETVLAAKFSIPHAIAATARLGTAGARAFTFDTLRDEGIATLRRRVRMAPYRDLPPFPKDRPARVTLRFEDGAEMSAVCESARGGADQPFDEPTLLSKLAENAGSVFPAVPDTLAAILRGERAVLDRPWRELLADTLRAKAPGKRA